MSGETVTLVAAIIAALLSLISLGANLWNALRIEKVRHNLSSERFALEKMYELLMVHGEQFTVPENKIKELSFMELMRELSKLVAATGVFLEKKISVNIEGKYSELIQSEAFDGDYLSSSFLESYVKFKIMCIVALQDELKRRLNIHGDRL